MRMVLLFYLFLFSRCTRLPNIDGIYLGLEFNQLTIDTSGNVDFYMMEFFPKEKWFYEVTVEIDGDSISVRKAPVHFDSLNQKWYSASDGGFLYYAGKILKKNDVFMASTTLVFSDYIGFSVFTPPKISNDPLTDSSILLTDSAKQGTLNLSNFEPYKTLRGDTIFLKKGTVKQDFIIRPDSSGLWINNRFYYRIQKQGT